MSARNFAVLALVASAAARPPPAMPQAQQADVKAPILDNFGEDTEVAATKIEVVGVPVVTNAPYTKPVHGKIARRQLGGAGLPDLSGALNGESLPTTLVTAVQAPAITGAPVDACGSTDSSSSPLDSLSGASGAGGLSGLVRRQLSSLGSLPVVGSLMGGSKQDVASPCASNVEVEPTTVTVNAFPTPTIVVSQAGEDALENDGGFEKRQSIDDNILTSVIGFPNSGLTDADRENPIDNIKRQGINDNVLTTLVGFPNSGPTDADQGSPLDNIKRQGIDDNLLSALIGAPNSEHEKRQGINDNLLSALIGAPNSEHEKRQGINDNLLSAIIGAPNGEHEKRQLGQLTGALGTVDELPGASELNNVGSGVGEGVGEGVGHGLPSDNDDDNNGDAEDSDDNGDAENGDDDESS